MTKGFDLEIESLPANKPLKNMAMCHETVKLGPRAQLANNLLITICSREGMARPSDQIVAYVSALVRQAFYQYELEGWLVQVPGLDELKGEEDSPVGFMGLGWPDDKGES